MSETAVETEPRGLSLEEEIIRVTAQNVERLPMLETIFERHAQGLGGALKGFTGVPVEAEFSRVDYLLCADALDGIDPHWLTVVCEADPWGGIFALAIDPRLLFSMLEILLGGRTAKPTEWSPRSFTSIEKNLARQVSQLVLDELRAAFAPVDEVRFRVSHFESSAQSTLLAPPKSPTSRVFFKIGLEGRGGGIAFVLPHVTVESVRGKLSELFMGEQIGGDTTWEVGMRSALSDTPVTLTAILQHLRVPLSEALDWKVGQVLDLGLDADAEVSLATSGRTLLRGAIGRRRSGAAAVRVTEILFDKERGTE